MMTQPPNRENMRNTFRFGLNSYLMIYTNHNPITPLNPSISREILFDGYLINTLIF